METTKHPDSVDIRPYRQVWPFFLILTIFTMYGMVSAINTGAVLDEVPLVLFAISVVVSTALYWASPVLTTTRPRTLLFCFVQGGLAFGIGTAAPGHWLTLAVFGALVGIGTSPFLFSWKFGLSTVFLCLCFLLLTLAVGWRWEIRPGALVDLAVMLVLVSAYVLLFVRQLQARVEAEDLLNDLENAHADLKESAARIEELSVGRERERMAIELHDTLIQGLAGLTMQLQAIDAHLERGDSSRARDALLAAIQRARSTQEESRRAVAAMLPTALEQHSFMEACRRELEQMALNTGVAGRVHTEGEAPRLPTDVERQLFRIVQEGLSNCSRHAMASEVTVRLVNGPDEFSLEIVDDGVGFDTGRSSEGMGLRGMRERSSKIGASLEIASAPGEGTAVRCRLPGSAP